MPEETRGWKVGREAGEKLRQMRFCIEEFLFLLSLSTNPIPLSFSHVVVRESDTPGAFRGKERSRKEIKNEDSLVCD